MPLRGGGIAADFVFYLRQVSLIGHKPAPHRRLPSSSHLCNRWLISSLLGWVSAYGTRVCLFSTYAAASLRSIQPSWLVSILANVPPSTACTFRFACASSNVTFPLCLVSRRLY